MPKYHQNKCVCACLCVCVCVLVCNRLASRPPVILLSTWTMEEQLAWPTCTLQHGEKDDVHSIQMKN